MLAACLLASSVAARPKLRSVGALARALSAKMKLPPGSVIYVGVPVWKGHGSHDVLCAGIRSELDHALSAANPSTKVLSQLQVENGFLAAGLQPLDTYFILGPSTAVPIGRRIGAAAVVTSSIREKNGAFLLTVQVFQMARGKRLAKLKALLPDSPRMQALFSQPERPIKGSTGAYMAGIGGVRLPRCVRCRNPAYPKGIYAKGTVILVITVGTDGRARNIELLKGLAGRAGAALDRAAESTVRSWTFRPAKGPSGQLVAVRMPVEINFRQDP
jgi:TonB family protein